MNKTTLIILAIVASYHSLAAGEKVYIIPDPYFKKLECDYLTVKSEKFHDLHEKISKYCSNYTLKTTDKKWLENIESAAHELQRRLSDCENCMYKELKNREPVPTGYDLYVLALFPSPELIDEPQWVFDFQKKFKSFGNVIGERKAAIWLGGRYNNFIDVEYNQTYCLKLNLSLNDGPYMVISRVRPDLIKSNEEFFYIKLHAIPEKGVIRILNILIEDIKKEKGLRKRTLIYEEVKARLMSLIENNKELKDVVISLFSP